MLPFVSDTVTVGTVVLAPTATSSVLPTGTAVPTVVEIVVPAVLL